MPWTSARYGRRTCSHRPAVRCSRVPSCLHPPRNLPTPPSRHRSQRRHDDSPPWPLTSPQRRRPVGDRSSTTVRTALPPKTTRSPTVLATVRVGTAVVARPPAGIRAPLPGTSSVRSPSRQPPGGPSWPASASARTAVPDTRSATAIPRACSEPASSCARRPLTSSPPASRRTRCAGPTSTRKPAA